MLTEQSRHLVVVLLHRVVKWRPTPAVLGVHLGTFGQEEFGRGQMAFPCRRVQRRTAGGILRIDRSALGQDPVGLRPLAADDPDRATRRPQDVEKRPLRRFRARGGGGAARNAPRPRMDVSGQIGGNLTAHR